MTSLGALVVDWGGVLTPSLGHVMGEWLAADGIDPHSFSDAMRAFLGRSGEVEAEVNPVHALERGEMEVPDFERRLAQELRSLDGSPVQAEGLLTRMFAGFRSEESMLAVVRAARRAGLRTALLSNSWGLDYDRSGWGDLFDVVVISGEVGMRKPDPAIFRLCAERLGLPPSTCVMVDDLPPNVRGAVEAGMVAVHHTSVETTRAELEALLGVPLGAV